MAARFEYLAVRSASAEAVMSVDALQYATNKAATFAEVRRVLRDGGRFVFTAFEVNPSAVAYLPVLGIDPVSDFRPTLEAAGFAIEAYEESDGWKERVATTYEAIRERLPVLTTEFGYAAATALGFEVSLALQWSIYGMRSWLSQCDAIELLPVLNGAQVQVASCCVHGSRGSVMVYREVIMKGVLASLAAVCGFVVLVTPVSGAIQFVQGAAVEPLQPLAFLMGRWEGSSEGQPGRANVQREYTRILNSRFIRVQNKSVYPPQEKNPKGETHEDFGVFSFDKSRKVAVLRQFHVEGFVNQYVFDLVRQDRQAGIHE